MAVVLATTVDEVEKRLRADLDTDDVDFVEGLIEEATILVKGFLGRVPDPVPWEIKVVASRMVARVLESPSDAFSEESASYTSGPFSKNVTYRAGSSGGSPWLTAVDKKALSLFRRRGGVYSVEVG